MTLNWKFVKISTNQLNLLKKDKLYEHISHIIVGYRSTAQAWYKMGNKYTQRTFKFYRMFRLVFWFMYIRAWTDKVQKVRTVLLDNTLDTYYYSRPPSFIYPTTLLDRDSNPFFSREIRKMGPIYSCQWTTRSTGTIHMYNIHALLHTSHRPTTVSDFPVRPQIRSRPYIGL